MACSYAGEYTSPWSEGLWTDLVQIGKNVEKSVPSVAHFPTGSHSWSFANAHFPQLRDVNLLQEHAGLTPYGNSCGIAIIPDKGSVPFWVHTFEEGKAGITPPPTAPSDGRPNVVTASFCCSKSSCTNCNLELNMVVARDNLQQWEATISGQHTVVSGEPAPLPSSSDGAAAATSKTSPSPRVSRLGRPPGQLSPNPLVHLFILQEHERSGDYTGCPCVIPPASREAARLVFSEKHLQRSECTMKQAIGKVSARSVQVRNAREIATTIGVRLR